MTVRTLSFGRSGLACRQAGNARIVAIVIAIPFLLLIAAFMVMPFLNHSETRLNAIGPVSPAAGFERGGVRFSGAAATWEVKGQAVLDAQRRMYFAFDLIGPNGQPAPGSLAPQVVFESPETVSAPLRPAVSRHGPGAYSADEVLPVAGRWLLRIELPDIAATLTFDVTD